MADLSQILDSKSSLYTTHESAWRREESRLQGGDAVLDELIQFSHEESATYTARKKWARWLGFGRVHTTILSGHITSKIPVPSYGKLGEVRQLGEMDGSSSDAELFHYNCDGIGTDGQQLPAFMDGVQQRALATGVRWLMAEMPTRQSLSSIRLRLLKGDSAERPTGDEVSAGFRPYLVEYSPLSVTNWKIREGVLCWAVIRLPVDPVEDFGQVTGGLGYYLLVRQGYQGLGEDFAKGGWWKYDAQKQQTSRGTWADTDGQIPLWMHVGEPGRGTYERPSIGLSSTMELGQISADHMNAQSEQRYNARQAAKSINYFLGIDPESQGKVAVQEQAGSITVGVPAARNPDGTYTVPTIWNSSQGALATDVYATILAAAVSEAKEIMVRQIVAAPDASGARVEAEHASATSPMLARIAGTAETSWNTGLYFVARRFGLSHADAMALSVAIPRDFKLRDLQSDIDLMLDRLATTAVRSATLEKSLLLRKADELDLIPEKERTVIETELGDTKQDEARLNRLLLQGQAAEALIKGFGATEAGAAELVGLTASEIRTLLSTPNPEPPPGQGLDTPPPAPFGAPPAGQPAPPAPPAPPVSPAVDGVAA